MVDYISMQKFVSMSDEQKIKYLKPINTKLNKRLNVLKKYAKENDVTIPAVEFMKDTVGSFRVTDKNTRKRLSSKELNKMYKTAL